jgi:hypothetical protein
MTCGVSKVSRVSSQKLNSFSPCWQTTGMTARTDPELAELLIQVKNRIERQVRECENE